MTNNISNSEELDWRSRLSQSAFQRKEREEESASEFPTSVFQTSNLSANEFPTSVFPTSNLLTNDQLTGGLPTKDSQRGDLPTSDLSVQKLTESSKEKRSRSQFSFRTPSVASLARQGEERAAMAEVAVCDSICFELSHGRFDPDNILHLVNSYLNCAVCAFSLSDHSEEHPSIRIIAKLETPITPTRHQCIMLELLHGMEIDKYGIHEVKNVEFNAVWPSVYPSFSTWNGYIDGAALDLESPVVRLVADKGRKIIEERIAMELGVNSDGSSIRPKASANEEVAPLPYLTPDRNRYMSVDPYVAEEIRQASRLRKDGKIVDCLSNLIVILEHDPALRGQIRYDLFSSRIMAMSGLPWFKETHNDSQREGAWNDSDFAALNAYLSFNYELDSDRRLSAAITNVAHRNEYHPVRQWLEGLRWDGRPRVGDMIIRHLGADDNECTRQMTELLMVGAVARVFQPGIKFDYVTVLQGSQGCYKSTICRSLFEPWFTDSLQISSDKEAQDHLNGLWGVELAELAGLKRADLETIKAFIVKEEDSYRPAYARTKVVNKRQCVFMATTNEEHFLKDDFNRRYNVIRIKPEKRVFNNPRQSLMSEREQLWAEAYNLYMTRWKNRPLVLSEENAREQARRNSQANLDRTDSLRLDLMTYLETPLPEDWDTMDMAKRQCYYRNEDYKRDGKMHQRTIFSLREFLLEYYGFNNIAEAKARIPDLRGQLQNRVKRFIDEYGQWSKSERSRENGVRKTFYRLIKKNED